MTSEAYRRGVNEMAIRLVEANKHLEEANVAHETVTALSRAV